MASCVFKDGCASFINAIAEKRRELKNWTALMVQASSNDNKQQIALEEIVQVLEFQLQGNEILMLTLKKQQRVFVVTRNQDKEALSIIEQSIAKTFPEGAVKVAVGIPLNSGLEYLCRLLGMAFSEKDIPASISLKRLARPTNTFLIANKDIAVIDQITEMVQGFGHVAICQKPEQFFELYTQYAPNAVFLDADFLQGKNESLIASTKKDFDPSAHIIIVSEKISKAAVLKFRKDGADGFILRPFARDIIFKQLNRVVTFAPYQQLKTRF